jgi:hypothetical protein
MSTIARPLTAAGAGVLAFSTPATNAATAVAYTAAGGAQYAVGSFTNGVSQSVQDQFPLPTDWTGAIDIAIYWRSTVTTGNVTWQVQTGGVSAGAIVNPTFNTADTVTDTVPGSASQIKVSTITGLNLTGLAADGVCFWKLARSASDTAAAAAEILEVRFTYRRSM